MVLAYFDKRLRGIRNRAEINKFNTDEAKIQKAIVAIAMSICLSQARSTVGIQQLIGAMSHGGRRGIRIQVVRRAANPFYTRKVEIIRFSINERDSKC